MIDQGYGKQYRRFEKPKVTGVWIVWLSQIRTFRVIPNWRALIPVNSLKVDRGFLQPGSELILKTNPAIYRARQLKQDHSRIQPEYPGSDCLEVVPYSQPEKKIRVSCSGAGKFRVINKKV